MKLPEIDLSRWSMPALRAQLTFARDCDSVRLVVSMQVKNVDTGEVGPVLTDARLDLQHAADPKLLRLFIEDTLRHVLFHELAECLYIDGEQVRDPHPEQRRDPKPE